MILDLRGPVAKLVQPLSPEGKLGLCHKCERVDEHGDKLFRESALGPTCGRTYSVLDLAGRDQKTSGCGCLLNVKTKLPGFHCPFGDW